MSEAIIHEQEFPFEEIRDEHGDYFLTVADAKKHSGYDESHIWSVTESDGTWSYGPSEHYINLIGFIATHEAHDGNTYYEEKDWRKQEELEEAKIIIHDTLVCAIEDSIGEGDQAKKIDEACLLILDHLEGEE